MGVQLTQEMINGAINAQNKYGVPASVTLAQIMLESGGSYPGGLSGLAYNDNNLFGIKAGSSWKGDTVNYKTTEYSTSKGYYTDTATFRKYDTIQQSIDDHGKLLNSSIYTNKTKGATSLEDYVSKMGSVYATSPNYAKSVMSIINSNNLTKYDNGKFPEGTSKNSEDTTTSGGGSSSSSGGSVYYSSSSDAPIAGFAGGGGGGGILGLSLEEKLNEIISKVIKISFIVFICIMAVIFLFQTFDFKIDASGLAKKVIKKKTGVDINKAEKNVKKVTGGINNG